MSWTDKKISLPSFLGSSEKPKHLHDDGHGSGKSGATHHEEPQVLMKAMLKKIKKNNHFTKPKLFVLYDRTADAPAKLVYFDSEKKYLQNRFHPKREINLKTCLNINRRRDAKDARGQDFMGLDIYTPEDRLQISFDNHEDELNEWLERLLILHQGATNFYGKKPLPNFEAIWQVNLKGFEPDAGNDTKSYPLTGAYRLGVTSEYLELFRLGDERGIKLHHPCIRKYMFNDKNKVLGLELGRTSPLGPGVISIESEEKDEIQQIHDSLLKIGRCANSKEILGIPGRHRSSSLGQDRVPKTTGISHPTPTTRQPYRSEQQRNRTISEPVDGGAVTSVINKQLGNMSIDSSGRYRIGGGRMAGVGSPTSPMGSTTGLSDGGTGSSSSINDPNMDFDPHFSHQPEVIPEESSGEISIEFPGNSDHLMSAYSRKEHVELAGAAASLPRNKSNRANVFHSKQPSLPDDYLRMDISAIPPALPARNQEFNLSTSLPSGGAVVTTSKVSQSTASPTDSQPSNSLSSEYQGRPSAGGNGTQHSTPLLSPENPYLPMDQISQMLATPPRSSSLLQSSPPNLAPILSPPTRQIMTSPRSYPHLEGLTSTPGSSGVVMPPSSISTQSAQQPQPASTAVAGSSDTTDSTISNRGKVRIPSGEAGYVIMSPGVQINLESVNHDEPASLAAIEEALGGRWHSSPYHTSPGMYSLGIKKNIRTLKLMRRSSSRPTLPEDSKRNSSLLDETDTSFSWRLNEDLDFTEDSDPRGMSPTGPTDDYMLIDYPRSGMGSTPRPISRSSPASSSSAMCGTPSSVSRSMVAPDMDRLEKVQSFLMDQEAIAEEKRNAGIPTSSSSRPPRGDTSSGRSSKSGRYIDIPGSKLSSRGNMSFHLSGRTPPSSGHSGSPGVVSRLEGWFRNRAGSVPNRPQLNERRRHRTQSEGEKDAAAKDPINS